MTKKLPTILAYQTRQLNTPSQTFTPPALIVEIIVGQFTIRHKTLLKQRPLLGRACMS